MQKLLLFLHKRRTLGVAILMLASFFAALAFARRGIAVAESVRAKLATALDLTRRAMEVKFLVADFNGWQTAYAFDIVRGTPDATEDDARVRAKFLASAAAFRDKLRTMKEEPSIPDEHPDLEALEIAFQQFMDADGTVIAAYRNGGTVAVQQANELVLGRELEIFEELTHAITRLTDSIVARADLASREASAAGSHARWLFVGAAAATSLLVISCVLVLIRLLVQQADLLARIDAMTYKQRNADNSRRAG